MKYDDIDIFETDIKGYSLGGSISGDIRELQGRQSLKICSHQPKPRGLHHSLHRGLVCSTFHVEPLPCPPQRLIQASFTQVNFKEPLLKIWREAIILSQRCRV